MAVACRVLGFSKQAFYKWTAAPVSDRELKEAHLHNAAIRLHADDPEFGHRLIADELIAAGHVLSERRVWRLCSQQGLFSATQRRRRGPAKAAGDNAAMESFFSALVKNVLNAQSWESRDRLRRRIIHWIERTYHRRFRQRRLGKLTPVEYETVYTQGVALAA
ncbi:hypothetical protein GCM10011401_27290 [Nesterenkonia cremea]|uniref:HTH-like domain-containing protein n=1 Tax=Nesterenkonia cremea TaxID=1882340 RepID=A0A917AWT7_9MICC|nr:hypothetical protein GCM10011401_27290 [Nesterenkonia cremea]